ncbi:hypothetical protein PHYSODRAFT_320887 [Phytophthora sojae]|uniref:Uncharacterized protein n=1 Tax=Phytophthora sojae (strain P6497) TaxID=1094619 RepID=G4YGS2_PHYSP|nr:hypothetical protein PHYSODRAFT_320887 [Phytophthora sojae]EGZ27031.1 hypothetical protein PHYSODRAFT_320887 [Phytophthora sojae]|eukprot:XP_009514306.1 hypothetical protein PHYSODRAFT_320887 [Phytophthora sojae]
MTLEEYTLEDEQMTLEGVDRSASRPIPVLLLPRETVKLYEQSFELWLFKRNITLETLEGDPEVERLFRLDFADSRIKKLRRRKMVERLAPPTRSMSAATTMNSSRARKRYHYQGVRSRRELLRTSVVSVQELHRADEMEGPNGRMMVGEGLRPIPIVLDPCQSPEFYEVNFKRWLAKKKVTLDMLQDDLEEERRYRQCFAYARAANPKFPVHRRSRSRSRQSTTTCESRSNRTKRSSSRERPYSKRRTSAPREYSDDEAVRKQKRSRVNANESTGQGHVQGIQRAAGTVKTECKAE